MPWPDCCRSRRRAEPSASATARPRRCGMACCCGRARPCRGMNSTAGRSAIPSDPVPMWSGRRGCGSLRAGEAHGGRKDGPTPGCMPAGCIFTGLASRRFPGAWRPQPPAPHRCLRPRHPPAEPPGAAHGPHPHRALAPGGPGAGAGGWVPRGLLPHGGGPGLGGWVRNCSDGSVEIEAEGLPRQLGELRMWCEQGPQEARVSRVVTSRIPITGEDWFEVRS